MKKLGLDGKQRWENIAQINFFYYAILLSLMVLILNNCIVPNQKVKSILYDNSKVVDSTLSDYTVKSTDSIVVYSYKEIHHGGIIAIQFGKDTTISFGDFRVKLSLWKTKTFVIGEEKQTIYHFVPKEVFAVDYTTTVYWNPSYGILMLVAHDSGKEKHFLNNIFSGSKEIYDTLNLSFRYDTEFFLPFSTLPPPLPHHPCD